MDQATTRPPFFAGIPARRWLGYAVLWLIIGALFFFLYSTARKAILNEIRAHAMGVAIAIAAGLEPDLVNQIRGPDDMHTEAFRQIQRHLDRASLMSADIRYVYLMRRDPRPDAAPTDYLYVVDQSARDENQNGAIDPDEISEPSGAPYDATEFPQMVEAWDRPTADYEVTPDPPYPDLISGYAPIKDDAGRTVAIVGADITAPTVRRKYFAVQAVNVLGGVLMGLLITLVIQLYIQQREALRHNQRLSQELAARNEMLRNANAELSRFNAQFQQELELAQHVQLGFLPKTFPREDRIVFDKFYVTCAILGGDLFDVFVIDDDHVGLYMADVAGHGVSAALVSGLLKMAVSSVRERHLDPTATRRIDLAKPDQVLGALNDILVREMPEGEFITMVYAVIDLKGDRISLASAGHPPPVYLSPREKRLELWQIQGGLALGIERRHAYPVQQRAIQTGDRVIFYTDGLTEAMNSQGEEFGEERVIETVRRHGDKTPSDLTAAICAAVEAHRGGCEVSDDFTILIAELR